MNKFFKSLILAAPLLIALQGQAQTGGATAEQTEDHIKNLLEANGFYSAALLQGKAYELYKPAYDMKKTIGVTGIVFNATNAEDTRFDLFTITLVPEQMTDERTLKWSDMDLEGNLQRIVSGAMGITKDGFTILKFMNALVGIREVSKNEYRFVYVPFKKDLTLVGWKESFKQADGGLDESNVTCDVFTKDRASAKAVNLAQQRTEMLAALKASAKSIGGAWEAQDQAEIDAATFPVAAQQDAALEKKILAAVQKSGKEIDFDPVNLKKLIIADEDWSIRRNEFGEILGKTIGATLGFSKNGHCYFVSIQVQKDYAGGGNYQESIYFNGFHTRWTELLCDKLK